VVAAQALWKDMTRNTWTTIISFVLGCALCLSPFSGAFSAAGRAGSIMGPPQEVRARQPPRAA
jgi:hypothetical protein